MTTMINIKVAPRRMLSGSEAATYCGLPAKRFHALCNCQPVAMPHGQKLYDIVDLDGWLDSLKVNAPDSDNAIVGKLGNDNRAA